MSESKKRYCSQCGSEIDATCKFCPNCGAKIVKIEKDEKDEINAVMNELFETEEVRVKKEDTVVIPKFSEPVRPVEPVREERNERINATPKAAQRTQTRRPVEKESKLPVILTVAAVALVVLLVAGGGFMIYKAMQSPADPNPPVVDNNNNNGNNQNNNQNNQNDNQPNEPNDNTSIATEDDKVKPDGKDLKEGVVTEFISEMGQLEGVAAITEIKVQDMDNGNLRFNISYESAVDLTMIFANAPDAQIFRIEVDVTSGGQAAYFEVSKSILNKDMAVMVTLFEQIQEGSASDGTPIGSGSATISAETMAELLELAGE